MISKQSTNHISTSLISAILHLYAGSLPLQPEWSGGEPAYEHKTSEKIRPHIDHFSLTCSQLKGYVQGRRKGVDFHACVSRLFSLLEEQHAKFQGIQSDFKLPKKNHNFFASLA